MSAPRYRWQPTTARIAARFGIPERQVVRFDHNTSPYPTDWAPGLLAEPACRLNEYPGADYAPLRAAAARYAGVAPENVVPGAGVDEIIAMVARAFLEPGGLAGAPTPTYPLYRVVTHQRRARLREVPLEGSDFGFPVAALQRLAREVDLLWLCVPNNPTGVRLDDATLAELVAGAPGIVVLDAAYAEISGDRWGAWISRHPNLVVCHTLSKGFGLAGIRVGYALATPELVATLDAVRPPGSISSLSALLAERALDDPARMTRRVARIVRERSRLAELLAGLGFRVLPSAANFLLCEVGSAAPEVAERLLTEGLVVRTFPADGPLDGYLRFTVRSPEEDDRLVDALERALS